MARVLILFTHPALEKSRVHRRLIGRRPEGLQLTFHDLYEAYPDYDIDVAREQALLTAHDLIILQHPFFWYSTPPLLKQWEDLVLEHGWAYGSSGTALRGKRMVSLLTTGGRAAAYQKGGHNRFTIREFLRPIEQTARLCGMDYLPPYIIYGTHRLSPEDIDHEAERYRQTLRLLHDDRLDYARAGDFETLNEMIAPYLTDEVRP